jgi:hypothetical protein
VLARAAERIASVNAADVPGIVAALEREASGFGVPTRIQRVARGDASGPLSEAERAWILDSEADDGDTEALHSANVVSWLRIERRGEDPRDAVAVRPRKSGPEDRIAAQLVRSLIEFPALIERVSTDELLALLPAGPVEEIVQALASGPRAEKLDVEAICEHLGDDTKMLLRELATNNAELDADTASRILDDTIQWLRKRLRKEEGQALTQQLRDEGDDWRTVLEAKQRLQEQSVRQEHRRTSLTT